MALATLRAPCALVGALALALLAGRAGATDPDAGPPPEADPAARWLDHARACLAGKRDLQADFTQEVLHPLGGAQPAEHGQVQLRRGGRLRLEYRAPARRLLVCDGTTIRAHDPGARVVYESPARGGALSLAFAFALEATGNDRFAARWLGGAPAPTGDDPAVIELTPRAPDPLASRVLLTLEPRCPAVRRITVIDRSGVAVRITLANQRFDVGIGARRFELRPPPGTRVITP